MEYLGVHDGSHLWINANETFRFIVLNAGTPQQIVSYLITNDERKYLQIVAEMFMPHLSNRREPVFYNFVEEITNNGVRMSMYEGDEKVIFLSQQRTGNEMRYSIMLMSEKALSEQ